MDNTKNDALLTKLGKLKAHMESAKAIGSEEEAKAFAATLSQLLMKHKIEMTDLEYEAEIKDEPVDAYIVGGGSHWEDGKRVMKDFPDVEIKQKRCLWAEDLAKIVVRAHGCSMMVSLASSQLTFVGRKSNTTIAEYIFIILFRSANKMSDKAYRSRRNKLKWEQRDTVNPDMSSMRGYRDSWLRGFTTRIADMFEAELAKQRTPEGESTALIRINNDALAVRDYMKANSRRGPAAKRKFALNEHGLKDGAKAADTIGIKHTGMNAGNIKHIGD